MTLLADVVTASSEIAATSARSRKIAILAELLRRLDTDEISSAVGFLSGVPHQGRIGIGYSIAYGVESAPAAEASLTVGRHRPGDHCHPTSRRKWLVHASPADPR
jgi:DNA ligase 1